MPPLLLLSGIPFEPVEADGTKVYEVDLTKAPLREFVGQMVLENIKIKDILL